MKISNIQLNNVGKKCIVSADIYFRKWRKKHIYFAIDERYTNFISADTSPFVALSLLSAMCIGEDIEAEGFMSEKMKNSVYEMMRKFNSWNPKFKLINIKVHIKPDVKNSQNYQGLFFSGGVDSFYTFVKNREIINSLIFIHGFDIEVNDTRLFNATIKNLNDIAQAENIPLIVVETNARELADLYTEWNWTHGGVIAAVALLMRRNLSKIFISSSNSWDEIFPYGTHPEIDPLWSTESLQVIHDGNEAKRLEKVQYIAKNPAVKKYLKVCYNNLFGSYNCGKCAKCLRTMVELKIAGILEATKTFNCDIDLELLKNQENNPTNSRHFGDALIYMREHNIFPELQKGIEYMLSKNKKISLSRKIYNNLRNLDRMYSNGKISYFAYWQKKRLSRILSN